MNIIKTTILIEPVAKGRPRLTVVNGHGRAYTPEKTRNAEQMIQVLVRQQVLNAQDGVNGISSEMPIKLIAIFYRRRPKHLSKRVTIPVTRPDLDNYGKLLLDALNRFVFPDDAQITSMTIKKRFAEPGTTPRIDLEITEDREG